MFGGKTIAHQGALAATCRPVPGRSGRNAYATASSSRGPGCRRTAPCSGRPGARLGGATCSGGCGGVVGAAGWGGEGLARCVAMVGNLVGRRHGWTSSSSSLRVLTLVLHARLPRHAGPRSARGSRKRQREERVREREIGEGGGERGAN